ncbi:MAG: hypothetical protein MJA28_06040 [Gammaproteobacteria bacterium]|nr:hypothetical protein [Gammaproteobacteria bacterium]
MRKQCLKMISTVWLVLALVSQSLAAVHPSCTSMNSGIDEDPMQKHMMMAEDMSHSDHCDSTPADALTANSCCEGQACSMFSCASLTPMIAYMPSMAVAEMSISFPNSYRTSYSGTEPVSLYRPPISR